MLRTMEKMSRIVRIDSCLSIYSYLMLFGKTTPAELRQVTGQSKATMFRNLALMSDAGILAHEEDSNAPDKRYSQHYYISRNIIEMNKELSSQDLVGYAASHGKAALVSTWANNLEFLPSSLAQHSTQLLISISSREEEKGSSTKAVMKVMVFRMGEGANPDDITKSVQDFVNWFDGKYRSKRRDLRKPMQSPVVLSMSIACFASISC